MSTSSTSSTPTFTGQSNFSAQLQNVISHAVATAQLPITQLQNTQSSLTGQQSELQTLSTSFQGIQSALDSINSAVGTGSYSATVSNTAAATAIVGSEALAGTYAVDVTSLGSQSNAISQSSNAVTDPSSGNISTSSTFKLTVNGTNYSLTPSANNLDSLVQAINASGANVQATVVNLGGSASPNYQLSIQSGNYAPDTIQLNDGTNSLLSTLSTGSYVTYQINGEPTTPINASSRSLPISSGLNLNVSQTGTVNVTVGQSTSELASGLSSFATAYNAAVDELAKNRGQSGGALTGQSILSDLNSALSSLTNYTSSSSGSIKSLADLGLSFDTNGHLQFDATTVNSATSLTNIDSFLGSETGSGFLKTAYSALTSITDSTTGTIALETNALGSDVTTISAQITAKQAQVTQLQSSLTQQIAAADAAIASLEQQQTQTTDLFAAETLQSQNYNNG